MLEKEQSFIDLRRNILLVILPILFLSALVSIVVNIGKQEVHFDFIIKMFLACTFMIGWFAALVRWKMKLLELIILFGLYVYHWLKVTIFVRSHLGVVGTVHFDSFVVWLPLIIIFTYAIWSKRLAIRLSLLLLIGSIIPSVYYINELSAAFLEYFAQLILAMIVYILVLIFSFKIIRTHAEVEIMRRQLRVDPLTQVGNRFQIDEWMQSFLGKAKEDEYSIIFFDIDHFKEINDQFGHNIGDEVLRELAQVVQNELKKNEHFGRWGGEEFMIILRGSECAAYRLAEILRQAIESHNFTGIHRLTASFGVTGYIQGDTTESMLLRVDQRLYASKNVGRNIVTGRINE
ncbi:GGDEF domain-containing protein [Sporosarcina pasteurii]|uniref:Stalked cell differentiation-controlling protein n=1 Tax=Sporosarcina pasteurii TaxID=1474 RepID=A0A380CJS7_SPOPA|nr:GGDEF domain-containing protein [Sporosarcina pasteurii]MDS9472080.1 GGDEF domain-containing protein [Sporosarcina pasteurii]QBQ06805.1 GGDEF domain-containing protein [Sporosarcina pasteurii]SUJ20848.1 Stalked cell differentiation-controlling protein [Sporosarcina pasteurii]